MSTLNPTGVNGPQIEYWNGPNGERWAEYADNQDAKLQPLGMAAIDNCDICPGHKVLDTGCGSGTTSFELAHRVGENGRVVGVDISGPMLSIARERLANREIGNVTFVHRDVATYPFKGAEFDRAFSRFGVMFFVDPVAAFANIRRGLKSGGKLSFVCWRERKENAWMDIPLQIAIRYVSEPTASEPGAPGPTSFANPDRVRRILSDAGYKDIELQSLDIKLRFERDAKSTAQTLTRVGSTWRLIRDASEGIKDKVEQELVEALRPLETDEGVKLGSACWLVSAWAP
jgi:ubiquinone/menaquinone biosynthesis C-methylase UbiE